MGHRKEAVDAIRGATGAGAAEARDALQEVVVKMLLAGADITQMASELLRRGPLHLRSVLMGLRQWMEEREYQSVEQMKGSMSYRSVTNPADFERANYIRSLKEYR